MPLTLLLAAALAVAPPPEKPAAADEPLTGLTQRQLRARLGEPEVANGEGKGALWTYRLPACALLVFLEDTGRGLRVSGAAPGPLRRGGPQPTLEACLASKSP